MILESIKTVFKVFKTNKMRTFLTMLGMIIGIFSITIILSLSDSTKRSMSNSISMYYEESIYLSYFTNNYIEDALVYNDIEEYIRNNKIKSTKSSSFYPEEIIRTIESSNSNYYYSNFLGIDENFIEINKLENTLVDGRLLSKKDIISNMEYAVINEGLAKVLYSKTNVIGETLNINNYEFEIIGVVNTDDTEMDVGILIPYNFIKKYLENDSTTYQLLVNKDNKKQVEKDIKNILNEHISNENYELFSMNLEEYMESFNSIIEIIELVFVGIASLSIIVG